MGNWIRWALAKLVADATAVRDEHSTDDKRRREQPGLSSTPRQIQIRDQLEGPAVGSPGWAIGAVTLDLYEVKETIEGGMGVIHRVRHLGWGMDLAVKVPRPEFFRTERQKSLFVAECERWIELGLHPNLVSCYYVRLLGGMPTVFAEWVDGGSLAEWIKSRRLYSGDGLSILLRILDIAIQFAWGLHYSHVRRVVHQDVKPSNVMVGSDGVVKVTDFGIARAAAFMGPTESSRMSAELLVVSGGSTRPYRSPEQARVRVDGESNRPLLSHKTDVWSWAVSVLEMFCGGLIWDDGQIAAEVLREIDCAQMQTSLARQIPAPVHRLLSKCLQVDPAARPNSMIDVVRELLHVYEESAGGAYPRQLIRKACVDGLASDLRLATGGDVCNRALSLVDLGRSEDAAALLRLWLRDHPTDPVARCNEALIRVGLRETFVSEAARECVDVIHPSRPKWQELGVEPRRYLSFVARHCIGRNSSPIVGFHWLPTRGSATSISQDGLLIRWSVEEDGWVPTLEARSAGRDVTGSWLITDEFLLVGHENGRLELWAVDSLLPLNSVNLEPSYTPPHSVLSGTSLPISNAIKGAVYDSVTGTVQVYLQNADAIIVSMPRLEVLSDRHEQRDFTFSVAAPSDGSYIVVGEAQGVLRFYEPGRESPFRIVNNKHRVPTHDLRTGKKGVTVGFVDLRCLACSPDAVWIATGSREGGVLLWRSDDIIKGPFDQDVGALKEWIFPGPIQAVAFSPDSRVLFFSDGNNVVRSVDLSLLNEPTPAARLGTEARILAFCAVTNSLAAGCTDGTIMLEPLLGLHNVDLPFLITRPTSAEGVLRKQDELQALAAGSRGAFAANRFVECYELLERALSMGPEEEELRESFRDLLLSLPGRRIKIRSVTNRWSFSDFERALQSVKGRRPFVNAVAVASQFGTVVVATDEGLQFLRLRDGKNLGRQDVRQVSGMDYDEHLDSCAFCTVLGTVGAVSLSGTPSVVSSPTGRTLTSIARIGSAHPGAFVCASEDGHLVFFRGANQSRSLHVMRQSIEAVAVAPDSTWLVAAGLDGFIGCIDATTFRGLARLEGHTDTIRCLQFHPEGVLLASGSDDTTVRLWDVGDRSLVRVLAGHRGRVQALAFSVEGDWLATGDCAGDIRIWEVFGDLQFDISSSSGEVSALTFDKEGGVLFSGHREGTVNAWELAWCLDLAEGSLRRRADQQKRREAARAHGPRPS